MQSISENTFKNNFYSYSPLKSRRRGSFLSNPSKHFFPMNISPTKMTGNSEKHKKDNEKLPEFLKEILLSPSRKPRASSQVRLKIQKDFQHTEIKKIDKSSCFCEQKREIRFECNSFERFLYKPTVFNINPRSKITLFTLSSFNGSSKAIINSEVLDHRRRSSFNKQRGKKLRFLIPEFRKEM